MPTAQKIVFLDVDGTIIDHDGTMPRSAVAAIRDARAAGHRVLVNTGRAPQELDERLFGAGLDGIVCAGGAFALIDGEWVVERVLPVSLVQRMVDVFHEHGAEYALQARDATYATPGLVEIIERMLTLNAGPLEEVSHSLPEMPAPHHDYYDYIAKGVFAGADLALFDKVSAALGDEFSVITGTIPHFGTGAGEVTLPSINKGSALTAVAEHFDMTIADTIALGDNNNDLEMLQTAGVGIAMGVATPQAIAAADEQTASVADDGLAKAFLRHGLIDRIER